MSEYLCDNCLSTNINVYKGQKRQNTEMDCFCNDCQAEHYIVSSWYINRLREVNDG
jgi:Zn finger protein HypA/HybF involved in hydrogenase expression